MIRVLAAALAAGALFGASQASAADNPSPPTPPPPSAIPAPTSHTDPNQVVCKRQENTGSRLGGAKICHTRQEWADIAAAARTDVNNMQERGNLNRPPN